MNEHNPYQAPQTENLEVPALETELASRWARLGAAIIDGIIALVVMGPLMWFGGYFSTVMEAAQRGEEPSMGYVMMWGLLGYVVFIAVQFYPLQQSAQTWGKRLLQTRIVNLDGTQPTIQQLLFVRYLVFNGLQLIPIIGGVLSLVNVLFVFRGDKRCVHDLVAKTQVVVAR